MIWLPVIVAAVVLTATVAVRTVGTAPALTFDEHAATAAALLQPDSPLFTAAETAAIDELADLLFADEVDALLDQLFPTTTAVPHEES